LSSVFFTDSNTGYIAGDSGIILKTINGGTDWISQNLGTLNALSSVFFADIATGYVVGDSGTILKTINGGIDWISQNSGTSDRLTDVYFTDLNTGYVIGENGAILATIDGGASWISQRSGTSNNLHSVFYPDPNTGYAVGDGGTILKNTVSGVGVKEGLNALKSINIYPNPANNEVTIESPLLTADTRISIFNTNGKHVIEIQATALKTRIDISNLSPGVYFVKLQNKNTVEVRKLIKE
jgi:photosystem II stability/assembly factor-like uncharacterized protein